MNDVEARQFVLGMMLANAQDDDDGIRLLAESEPVWDAATHSAVLRAAFTLAFSGQRALAELAEVPLEEHLRDMALEAAVEVE